MGGLETTLGGLLSSIQGLLTYLGGTICVIGIIVGGLMRATAFGSERRIAASNVALSCAIVGFIIVLLAGTVQGALTSIF
jgi:type IV secretory pathway VirB2 component (pilin)